MYKPNSGAVQAMVHYILIKGDVFVGWKIAAVNSFGLIFDTDLNHLQCHCQADYCYGEWNIHAIDEEQSHKIGYIFLCYYYWNKEAHYKSEELSSFVYLIIVAPMDVWSWVILILLNRWRHISS